MYSRSSYERWIRVGLCISIAVLVCLILIAPGEGLWSRISDVLSRLSVSYVAGFIIYTLAVALPRKENQRNIGESVGLRTGRIIGYADAVLRELQRHSGPSFDRKLARLENLKRLCNGVNPRDLAPMALNYDLAQRANVAQYLLHHKFRSEKDIQRILPFSVYLDTHLIKLLNRLLDSDYFFHCEVFLAQLDKFKNTSLEYLAEPLFGYLQTINELEEYADSHLK